jgi:hypothetical protein
MRRVLRPGGRVYAAYGPLWFGPGGDHFAASSLSEIYHHVLLDPDAYARHVQANGTRNRHWQGGLRYYELGLFSYLTTSEYLEFYRQAGLEIEGLMLELSSPAVQFARAFPDRFDQLCRRHPRCDRDDFLIRANFVRLRKPGGLR